MMYVAWAVLLHSLALVSAAGKVDNILTTASASQEESCNRHCAEPNPEARALVQRLGATLSATTYVDALKTFSQPWSVRIGVTGMVGSGKSTYINTMRGLRASDPCAAAVGVREQHIGSTEGTEYSSPDNPCVVYVDLPGYGTAAFPTSSYADDFKLSSFDAVVILTADKIKGDDVKIFRWLRKQGVPVFYAFSRARLACENAEDDNGDSCEVTMGKLRQEARVKGFDTQPFMISARYKEVFGSGDNPWPENEYELLREAITASLGELQRNQMATSLNAMINDREEDLAARRQKALEAGFGRAMVAAANQALNPVPGGGIAGSAGIIHELQLTIKQIYGLDDESLRKTGHIDDSSSIGTAVSAELTTALAAGITGSMISGATGAEAAKYVPILGQMFGAGVGYNIVMKSTEDIADVCEKAYKRIHNIDSLKTEKRKYEL